MENIKIIKETKNVNRVYFISITCVRKDIDDIYRHNVATNLFHEICNRNIGGNDLIIILGNIDETNELYPSEVLTINYIYDNLIKYTNVVSIFEKEKFQNILKRNDCVNKHFLMNNNDVYMYKNLFLYSTKNIENLDILDNTKKNKRKTIYVHNDTNKLEYSKIKFDYCVIKKTCGDWFLFGYGIDVKIPTLFDMTKLNEKINGCILELDMVKNKIENIKISDHDMTDGTEVLCYNNANINYNKIKNNKTNITKKVNKTSVNISKKNRYTEERINILNKLKTILKITGDDTVLQFYLYDLENDSDRMNELLNMTNDIGKYFTSKNNIVFKNPDDAKKKHTSLIRLVFKEFGYEIFTTNRTIVRNEKNIKTQIYVFVPK